jgi:hypothetical protein
MKNLAKILIFLGLMCIYLLAAGGPGWRTLFGQKLAVFYGLGGVMALWFGGESIGTLEPTTMRPLFISLGVFLMIATFILMLGSRDVMRQLDRGANHPAPGKAEVASRLPFKAHGLGLPEVGR